MPESKLDKEIKEVTRDKLKAETSKVISEREKIDFEIEEGRRTWTKKFIWQLILIGGGMIAFLTFIIHEVYIPVSDSKNRRLGDSLYAEEQHLVKVKNNLDTVKAHFTRDSNNFAIEKNVNRNLLSENGELKSNNQNLSVSNKSKITENQILDRRKIYLNNQIEEKNSQIVGLNNVIDSLSSYAYNELEFEKTGSTRVILNFDYLHIPDSRIIRFKLKCVGRLSNTGKQIYAYPRGAAPGTFVVQLIRNLKYEIIVNSGKYQVINPIFLAEDNVSIDIVLKLKK